jgi:hypothetical protein
MRPACATLSAEEVAMTDYERHPGVDAYLDQLPDWQSEICARLRDLVHAADPGIEETVKRRVQPYFVLDGNVCALLATKDHVNLFLYDGAIVPDPDHIITGGHDNATARTIAFYRDDKIMQKPLTTMLRAIAANNRAGGWRKVKAAARP